MPPNLPNELVQMLHSARLRVRTALWLVPPTHLGNEEDDAVRLGLQAVNMQKILLDTTVPGQKYMSLTASDIFQLVDAVCQQGGGYECYLLYNLDLSIAALSFAERHNLWSYLLDGLPGRAHPLLIVMPQAANHLLPSANTLENLRLSKRLTDN